MNGGEKLETALNLFEIEEIEEKGGRRFRDHFICCISVEMVS
jgi:hypothetical protein